MRVDDLVSLKKKTKLSESEILTEKDSVRGKGGQRRHFYLKPIHEPEEPDDVFARAKELDQVGIGKAIGTAPFFKGKSKNKRTGKKPSQRKPTVKKPTPPKKLKTQTFLPHKPDLKRLKDPFTRLKLPSKGVPPKITTKTPPQLKPPQLKIPPGPAKLPKLPAPNLALPKPELTKPKLPDPKKPELSDTQKAVLAKNKKTSLTTLQQKAVEKARQNIKLDQKKVKTLTGKLEKLLDKPNLKQWIAINDQIPLVRNKSKRTMLKKELLRIQNLHYAGNRYFQKKPISIGPEPPKLISKPEVVLKQKPITPAPSKPPKLDSAMTPKPGEGIKTFAKRMGFASIADLEMAQKNLNGGKIGTDPKTGNKYVLKGAKYVDAKTWKASTQFRRLEILSKLKTVKQGGNAYKKLISQLDDIKASEKGLKPNKLKAGAIIEPETTKTDTRKVVKVKKIPKGALTDPNTRYVDGRYKVPRFVQSVGGAIKFAGLGAGVAFLWAGTDALAQAEFVNKTTKEQDALPDNLSPLKTLSPYQYYGGIGGAPVESIPFSGKATNITQTLGHGQPKERRKMLEDSFTNMKFKDTKELEYSDEFVTNNHVSVMGPDGVPIVITPGRGKRVWDLYNQPGTVIQIIPKFEVVAGKQMKISREKLGQGVTTFVMTGERSTPTGVYHDVSPEEKEGGTKLNPDGTPMTINITDEAGETITKNMYIPLRMELDHYKRIGEMPPADWYITDEDKEDIESGKKGQEAMQTVADYTLIPGLKTIARAIESLPGSLIPGRGLIKTGTRLWDWFTGENASEDAPEELTARAKEDKKELAVSPEIETKIVTYVNSWKGKPGAPDTAEEYNELINKLANEHDLTPALLKALGMTESTIQIQNDGTLNKWEPRGDRNLGTGGSFGIFHVRSDPDKKASVEQYNQDMGTDFTWEDIASNPRLSATIGAWYFKFLLDHHDGNEHRAYADYTGGQGAFFSTDMVKRNEVRTNAYRFSRNLNKIYDSGVYARPKESKNYIEKNIITEKGNKQFKDNDIFNDFSLSP